MENISQNARSERQGARASDEGHGQEHGPGREQRQQQGREQRQRQANADGRQRQASAGGRQPRVVSAAHLARLAAAREAVALPPITYPEDLPVSAHRREISDAIAQNQVVIVAGETGSGKTTQIPKILLELGRGRAGQIGHTQPRRIAARSVAERIAAELDTPLGQIVGYQVRFTDQSSDKTLVKVMTDGILLAQLQRDPRLLAYDTIVIDEAHERSLNIDFLLGYLARLLPTRPDLKLIITSATIDSERFAEHFSPANLAKLGGADPLVVSVLPKLAPIIEVTGRTYPVEVRYRPLLAEDKRADNRDDKQANKRNDKPDAKHNDNRGDRDLP
ncbi:MAG: DEAD/DEAH box helicase, partial [Cellulomonadaceae bacterium]|nr:DEAD/DEAH box helicase [Cellulomonadaceae bacterium]